MLSCKNTAKYVLKLKIKRQSPQMQNLKSMPECSRAGGHGKEK